VTMAIGDAPEIVALEQVRPMLRPGIPKDWEIDLRVGAGEVVFVEADDSVRTGCLVDLVLGLDLPQSGSVRLNGTDWRELTRTEALERRSRIGTVLWQGNWLDHQPVMDGIVLAARHHGQVAPDAVAGQAMRLARRFGLPGLPAGRPGELPDHVLLRASCVKAFVGEPILVVIEDPDVAGFPGLRQALAAEFIAVQNRGGAVICCVASLAAPVCGMLGATPWLRMSDRGLGSARRPHERLASLRQ